MVFGALFIFASSVHADTIYLKDGTMIKGAVKSEDEKTILIETGDTWKRVDKSNIEMMTKDTAPVEMQAEKNVQAQQSGAAASQRVTDLRLKFGSAAWIDKITENGTTYDVKDDTGRNIQIEASTVKYGQSNVGLLLSAGFFVREHSASDNQYNIEYDAVGVSLGIGMGVKANDHLHFEGKAELGLGAGNATITSPRFANGPMESGGYASFSLIAGAYYTFSKPGFQLGLELGVQTFSGEFTYAGSFDEEVEGTSGTANLIVGYRF
jgi:sRNA-binding regulator protein Hfq